MTDIATGDPAEVRSHHIQVSVNGQKVDLAEERLTGLAIKQAAIEQDVEIELGFQLSLKRGSHYEVIGDSDTIEAHCGEEFLAVAPDDNS